MLLAELPAEDYSIKRNSSMYVLDVPPNDRNPAGLQHFLEKSGAKLIEELATWGCCLIRGAGVASVDDFERIWSNPFIPWDGYPFMEDSRRKKGQFAVSSNYANGDQGALWFHQENHFLPLSFSPDWLAFCCHKVPDQGGETAVINVAEALASLPKSLQQKLEASATTRRSQITAQKWKEQFGSDFNQQEIEKEAQRHGVKFSDLKPTSVRAEYHRPYVLRHRVSDVATVHFERGFLNPSPETMKRYLETFNPNHVEAIKPEYLWSKIKRRNRLLALLLKDASASALKLSKSETDQMFKAWSDHLIAVPYQAGDVLLIDNMLTEHSALAWKGERELSVVIGSFA